MSVLERRLHLRKWSWRRGQRPRTLRSSMRRASRHSLLPSPANCFHEFELRRHAAGPRWVRKPRWSSLFLRRAARPHRWKFERLVGGHIRGRPFLQIERRRKTAKLVEMQKQSSQKTCCRTGRQDTVVPNVALRTFAAKRARAFGRNHDLRTRWVPQKDENASSIDSGSTSGVSVCMAWRHLAADADIFGHVRREHDRGGQAASALNIGVADARHGFGRCSRRPRLRRACRPR